MASGIFDDGWKTVEKKKINKINLWANISAEKLFRRIISKTTPLRGTLKTKNILNTQHNIIFNYSKTGLYIVLENKFNFKEIAHISFHFNHKKTKGSQSHIKVGKIYFDLNFIIDIESNEFDIEINHKDKDNFDKLENKTLLTNFINRVRDIIKNKDETFDDILTSRIGKDGTPGHRRKTVSRTRGDKSKVGKRLFNNKYYYKYLKYKSKYLKLKNEMKELLSTN